MSITTYSELQTAIATWSKRSDQTANIPDYIRLAEEVFSRRLRTRNQELALASTAIASNIVAIPANVVAIKSMWLVGYEAVPLKAQSLENIVAQNNTSGIATSYAWQAASWLFDGTGTAKGVLYRDIPALSGSNTTNWLLTASPSVYLFGALAELAVVLEDEKNLNIWLPRRDSIINEIQGADERDRMGGPLVSRAR